MIRFDVKKFSDGSTKTQLRVTWGYRDPVTHKVKQVTKKHFGYLEDAEDKNALIEEAKKYNESLKKESSRNINLNSSKPFYESKSSLMYNFGYKYLNASYNELEIDSVFENISYGGKTSLKDIFKLLVFSRILSHSSKRSTFQTCKTFFDLDIKSLSLQQIYRSLDCFYNLYDDLQDKLDKKVEEKIGRSRKEMFLDVTNYMTSIDFNDDDFYIPITSKDEYNENLIEKDKKGNFVVYNLELDGEICEFYKIFGTRKKGVSKSHSTDPIVSLGLLMDNNSLPVRVEMFPGNTSDSLELQPIIKKL